MKTRSWIAILVFSAAISLAACGPSEGDVCSPLEDEDMECDGDVALLCVCDEPDGSGSCPSNVGHWQVDSACSCDGPAIVCE